MGLMGAGGSIITVPIMVYMVGLDVVTATSYSLFVVGVTSFVGSISFWRCGLVKIHVAVVFALPAMFAIFFTRRYLIPAIPDDLGNIVGFQITRDLLILVIFSLTMLVSGFSMIVAHGSPISDAKNSTAEIRIPKETIIPKESIIKIAVEGVVIGILTGLIGVGGGFAIVPALVVLTGLPMRVAVGTSLTIIAAKSVFGFVADITLKGQFDWPLLLSFTGLSVVGILLAIGLLATYRGLSYD